MCISNISTNLASSDTEGVEHYRGSESTQPLPVRLESLQLLAMLTKKYFPLVRHCLKLICDLVQRCLHDPDSLCAVTWVKGNMIFSLQTSVLKSCVI